MLSLHLVLYIFFSRKLQQQIFYLYLKATLINTCIWKNTQLSCCISGTTEHFSVLQLIVLNSHLNVWFSLTVQPHSSCCILQKKYSINQLYAVLYPALATSHFSLFPLQGVAQLKMFFFWFSISKAVESSSCLVFFWYHLSPDSKQAEAILEGGVKNYRPLIRQRKSSLA